MDAKSAKEKACFFYLIDSSVNGILALSIIVLNGMIITLYCKNKRMHRKIPNILLMHQAVVDLFNAMHGISLVIEFLLFCIYNTLSPVDFIHLKLVQLFLFTASTFTSLLNFSLITVERLLAIYKPFFHRSKVTKKAVYLSIAAIWFISTGLASVTVIEGKLVYFTRLVYMVTKSPFARICYGLYVISVVSLTPILILTYMRAKKSVKNNDERKRRQSSIGQQPNITIKRSTKELQLVKIFGLMYLGFFVAFVPIFFYPYIFSLDMSIRMVAIAVWHVLLLLSSIFNPILTLIMKKDFSCRNISSGKNRETISRTSYSE